MKNVLKIVLIVIGAFIGAGFASGKEIYNFFYLFGKEGIVGIFISSILLIMVICKTLNIVNKNNISNYKEFLEYLIKKNNGKCKFLKQVINNVVNILILTSFFIMIAGFGAYFQQEYNVNSLIGSSVLAILSYIVLKRDIKGLVKINEILVPIIILTIIIIGIFYIDINFLSINKNEYKESSKCLINSVLYCSYNCIMLIPVLTTVKNYLKNKKQIFYISIISGIIILLLLLIMFFILNSNTKNMTDIDMPIVYILQDNIWLKNLYGIIILFSIFTTAISLGSGFLKNASKTKQSYTQIAKIMCITSVIVSQIGFSNLINLLYPIFGYIGILQIIKLFTVK